jgi:predicted tellurium resistance membrane protein TerC
VHPREEEGLPEVELFCYSPPQPDRRMPVLHALSSPEVWVSLATLTALEIVLGIDNIVFLSILAGKLPTESQHLARRLGLAFALVTRILLLLGLSWVMSLEATLFSVASFDLSGRKLILLGGGLFLLFKATSEVFERLEVEHTPVRPPSGRATLTWVVVQIGLLDIVFSLDSVITALGMAQQLAVMIAAVVLAVLVMMAFADAVASFIDRHPSMKVLALSFLMLVGVLLVAEGLGQHVNKGYVYFAMAFSLTVELLNIRSRKAQAKPVHLHHPFERV